MGNLAGDVAMLQKQVADLQYIVEHMKYEFTHGLAIAERHTNVTTLGCGPDLTGEPFNRGLVIPFCTCDAYMPWSLPFTNMDEIVAFGETYPVPKAVNYAILDNVCITNNKELHYASLLVGELGTTINTDVDTIDLTCGCESYGQMFVTVFTTEGVYVDRYIADIVGGHPCNTLLVKNKDLSAYADLSKFRLFTSGMGFRTGYDHSRKEFILIWKKRA